MTRVMYEHIFVLVFSFHYHFQFHTNLIFGFHYQLSIIHIRKEDTRKLNWIKFFLSI